MRLFSWKGVFATAVGLFLSAAVFAQSEDTVIVRTLDESRVVATAKPSSTLQTTLVQAVDHSDIERLGMHELFEAVRSFAGVNIRDYGGIGGIKTVSIRSLGSQHTAVSYDGLAISNIQSGQVDLSRFSLDNIEQVSLSIGQSDNIFQTARLFASAGALEIKTVRPQFDDAPVNIAMKMRFASFGTYNPYLMYQQRLGRKWAMSINGDWLTSKGEYPFVQQNGSATTTLIRKNGDVNNVRGDVNLYGDFGRKGTLTLKGNYYYSERGLPGSVVLYNEDARERLWDRNAFAQARYEVSLGEKWALQSSLKYSYAWNRYMDFNEKYAGGQVEDLYTQQEYYGSVATRYQLSEKIHFTLAEDLFLNTLDSSIPECPFPSRWTSLTALAGQYKDARLILTGSLLGTMTSEKVKTGTAAPSRQRLSPALSLSYKIFSDRNIRVRVSYKNVYRIPTFNDLYYNRVGNVNLKPERASQYNLGVTWSGQAVVIDYANISVDGYYNKVKDKIVAIPTLFIWKMMNMGEVAIAGTDINLSATKRFGSDMELILSGNYSYQYAVNVSDPESKTYKHQIPYTPRHSGNVNLSWINRWVNVGYLLTMVGDRYALPQNIEANRIDGYAEHTVSFNRTFEFWGIDLRLQVEVINLTDCMYDVIQYYPMPGRNYRLTIQIKF